MEAKLWRSKSGTWPMRQGDPPPLAFFDGPRPCPGDRSVALRLGPLSIALEGLAGDQAATLAERYGPWAAEGSAVGDDPLRVRVALEDREYFLEPPDRPEINPVFLAYDRGRVRYLAYRVAGWFDVRGGSGDLLLARGGYEPEEHAFENYVRAAVAWQAASRGGALVHAAAAVREGRAYLFYGESGAGKSTLSASNRRGKVITDDLSLVLPGPGGRLHVVGSPFRGTWEGGAPVTGSFPLAAGFRLVQAGEAEVRAVDRPRALSELVGNLPFVAESFARAPAIFEGIERAFRTVPLAHLHFRKDDSFWDAIARAGL